MSVLRLLSKQPASGPSSSSSHTVSPDPILALHVPSYGAVMMNPPDDPLNPQNSLYSEGPRNDQILHGEFEVILPPGSSRKRCKAIRVVMRTTVKLDLPGPGRLGEEDTIFERKVEVIAGNSEGLWLQEGSQRRVESSFGMFQSLKRNQFRLLHHLASHASTARLAWRR